MANERLGASFSIDINQLQAGLKTANRLIRESESQFKAAAAGMDDWSKSEAGLNARISSLNQITAAQREKVRALKENYQQLIKQGLDPASDRAIQLRTQINNEEAALAKNEKALMDNTIALAELGDEAQETGDDIEEAGNSFDKFGSMAKAGCAVAAAAIAAVGAAVAKITMAAVQNYAEYEQLVGGVETLFGASGQSLEEYAKSVGKSVDEAKGEYDKLMTAQDNMITNAANAYKTAGMSANEYMANVTGFSAALISSLDGDTVKAAAAADRAMTDISDNANKMGTDMQSIVDTYQSLARGNYQMLDNLKLGYGGTKTEMERMIADANKVKAANGEMANLSIDSFADITEAIHIIQDEMGITGTTAKEAASTISGSVNMTKAAWQNLLTGIADDTQDFDLLVNNFVDSVDAAANNLVPRIATALKGVVKLVEKLIPQIPPLIQEFLPVAIEGIMSVTQGLVGVLPTVVDALLEVVPLLLTSLIEMLPTISETLVQIIVQIINTLTEMLPTIVDAIIQVVPLLITSLVNAIPQLLQAAITLLMAIVQALPTIVQALTTQLPTIINTVVSVLIQNLPLILNAAIQLFMAIVKAIPQIIPQLVKAIPDIIKAMFNALTSPEAIASFKDAGKMLIEGLWNGISNMTEWIGKKIRGFGDSVLGGLKKFFGIESPSKVMANVVGKNLALGIGKGFEDNIKGVNSEIQSAMSFESPTVNVKRNYVNGSAENGIGTDGKTINVYQTNNYSQAHSRYEIYKSKQQTAAAVRLAMETV